MTAPPFTFAVRDALRDVKDSALESDLLFFEAWELFPSMNLGATLRASQIRRANPDLAAALEREIKALRSRRRVTQAA
ncbi:MAG TPA: hypothetical protein PLD10_23790 [Rhodopila sp.]|nr:hypothetical protein [Rhodopila sp.]